MNYIEMINSFWLLDEELQFSSNTTRLYFYLLKTANRLGWPESFFHGDEKTAANVGISKNTLKTVRKTLIEAHLIEFTEGGKGHASKSRYQLLTPTLTPTLTPNETKVEPRCQQLTPTIDPLLNKPNQTKLNKEEKEIEREEKPLVFPFTSELFFEKWNLLVSIPSWKKKFSYALQIALDGFKGYDEAFILEMIDQAIQCNWPVFKPVELADQFEKWKKQKTSKQKDVKQARFKPPNIEEVKEYCLSRKNSVDAARFIDFYTSRGWKYGDTKITDWRACVRTWEQNQKEKENGQKSGITENLARNVAEGIARGFNNK